MIFGVATKALLFLASMPETMLQLHHTSAFAIGQVAPAAKVADIILEGFRQSENMPCMA